MCKLLLVVAVVFMPTMLAAQEAPTLQGSLTSALKDPTTWAPAAATFVGKSADWHTSQHIFVFGVAEQNPHYTQSGFRNSTPVSASKGYWINGYYSVQLLGASFANNVVAHSLTRWAMSRWPKHRRAIHAISWAERIGFAVGGTYVMSAANWREWSRNRRIMAMCATPGVTCGPGI